MKKVFKDHFSGRSDDYQQYRPQYPLALFDYLATLTKCHDRAWDCATGTGQSALQLSRYFSEVIATDASETQIENAIEHANIHYRVALAEHSHIDANTVDLITVAQAVHWFDLERFTHELERVLKPDGVLALWTYKLMQIRPDINAVIHALYAETLGEYWPAERQMIENEYRDIHFPFHAQSVPHLQMQHDWNLSQVIGYLCTWSAVKNYEKATGQNPVEQIAPQLAALWGEPEHRLTIQWPLCLKVWLK